MRSTFRVLLVNDLRPGTGGGAEVHVDRLRRALLAQGDDVALFAGEVRHRGPARVLDLWDPAARARLRRVATSFRPDVVHVHNFQRELSPSVLGAVPGVPTVLTVHDHRLLDANDGPVGADRGPIQRLKQVVVVGQRVLARRRTDAVIAVSHELGRRLVAAGFDRVSVVGGFADRPAGPPGPPGDDVVFVGRLAPEKGVDVLFDAFARVADAHPGASLVVVGDGPDLAALGRRAVSLAPGRVRFVGRVDEDGVAEILRRARLVCAPSTRLTEGLPLVGVEAQLAGRALVVTDSPAYRELVIDSSTGLVVPLGDVGGLAAALDRLLADRELAAALGRAGWEAAVAARVTDVAVPRIRQVYADVLAGADGG